VVEAFRNKNGSKQLAGYVFLSTDLVNLPAYSGKPVITLIGMDTKGMITGVKVIMHSEPILLIGVPEEELTKKFIGQYVGKSVLDQFVVGGKSGKGVHGIDAVTGATVTTIIENQTILKSSRIIARQIGILNATKGAPVHIRDDYAPRDWQSLVKEGSIGHLVIRSSQIGESEQPAPLLDLYFGAVTPMIGRNVLGESRYSGLIKQLHDGDHAIFIIGNDRYSFKGSAFVRGAIFDRFNISQFGHTYRFKDINFYNLTDLSIPGAPRMSEGGIFIIRKGNFQPAYPWQLNLLIAKVTGARTKKFFSFHDTYSLPGKYIEGKREVLENNEAEETQAPWVGIWKKDIPSIILLSVALMILLGSFIWRERLVCYRKLATRLRYGVMLFFLVYIGYYKMAQPSITQLLTVIQVWFGTFQWSLFLTDPMIFMLWWFMTIALIFWGRGMFCGWICPFGALQEFSYRIFQKLTGHRFDYKVSWKIHEKLRHLKFVIFFILLAVSFYSMAMAEKLAEVEPFKTTFLVGPLNRAWPYMLYFVVILAICTVSYRFFCNYLCPLGAGLGIPSRFSIFGIKRRSLCSRCHVCKNHCGSGAIDDAGKINKYECIYCLECELDYADEHVCVDSLLQKKKQTQAGQGRED